MVLLQLNWRKGSKAFNDFLISFYLIYVFIPCYQAKILFLLDCLPPYRTVMSAKNFKVASHGKPGKQDNYIGDGLISMIEYKKMMVEEGINHAGVCTGDESTEIEGHFFPGPSFYAFFICVGRV